jgi:POT family proton-dependent oligopeptide transporter
LGGIWIAAALLTLLAGIPVARQLRHHPRGLWLLFFTEMWERFSYYGMRSLLIFYLTDHFLLDDRAAQGRYTAYVALNYLLPLAGGLLGDRVLGARRAVGFGALLLVAGHCTMAIESPPARESIVIQGQGYAVTRQRLGDRLVETLDVAGHAIPFTREADGSLALAGPAGALPAHIAKGGYQRRIDPVGPAGEALLNLALALIVVGVGYQKANMTALVGALYAGRPDRDQGFTLYMFGINIGAFWSAVLCGWLGMEVGWWAGFGLAGIGMAAGYCAFVRYAGVLGAAGLPPAGATDHSQLLAYGAAVPAVALVWWLVQAFALTGLLLTASTVAIAAYLAWIAQARSTAGERRGLLVAMSLIALLLVWTMLAEQQGAALSLFTDRNTSLAIAGTHVEAAQVQAFYMGFLLILVPALAWLWARLARRGRDPVPIDKFAIGFALQAISYLILGMSGALADAGSRVPLIVVVLSLLFHAASEMTLGPIGLAEVTRRAPARLLSTLAATWYLAVSWGQWLGGLISRTAASASGLPGSASLPLYLHLFLGTAAGAVAGGAATLGLAAWLKRPAAISPAPDSPQTA